MSKSYAFEKLKWDIPYKQARCEKLHLHKSVNWKNIWIGGLSAIILVTYTVLLTYFLIRQSSCETDSTSISRKTLPIFENLHTSVFGKSLHSIGPGNYSCVDGFHFINNKCWKLWPGPKSRVDAGKACFNLWGSTLFSIRNYQENQAVMEFVKDKKIDNTWSGLICNRKDPSSCTWDVQSGTTAVYNNFAKGYPSNVYGECVYLLTTGPQAGKWASGSCNEIMSFVCELPATIYDEDCEYNYDNNCYFPHTSIDQLRTSSEAQSICVSSGSTLASIHSANENRFVMSIMPPNSITAIGGVAFSKNSIIWYDGTPITFIDVITFQRGNCLFLYTTTMHWYCFDCHTDKALFVCKRRISGK